MAASRAYQFTFTVKGQAEDTFSVVSFKGQEYVSKPYRFEIVLAATDPNLKASDFLYRSCSLRIAGEKTSQVFHGLVFLFRHIRKSGGTYIYQIVLMPRLQLLTLNTRSRVFLKQGYLQCVKNILTDAGIDYALRPKTLSSAEREYTCQFNETDFAFVSRWLEANGLSYFFEEDKGADLLVIATAKDAQKSCRANDAPLKYSSISGLDHPQRENVVRGIVSEHGCVPRYVSLRDYKYNGQDPVTGSKEVVGANTQGVFWQYGGRPLPGECGASGGNGEKSVNPETVLAEQLESAENIYQGETYCPDLRAGRTLTLKGHYRAEYNQTFYLYHVAHKGSDNSYALSGSDKKAGKTATQTYANTFDAVPASCSFRPRRTTPVPRYHGLLTAFIDIGEGQQSQGAYAALDGQGRYQVRLPFDLWQSKSTDTSAKESADQSAETLGQPASKGKVSHWIRLAQPYAGNASGNQAFGMHFPLLKGTEVLLSFVEGDIDRPVITGAVYNSSNTSPVTSTNVSKHILRTRSGCSIELDDTQGKASISLVSPGKNSLLRVSDGGVTQTTTEKTFQCSVSDTTKINYGSSLNLTGGSYLSAMLGSKVLINAGVVTNVAFGLLLNISKTKTISVGANNDSTHKINTVKAEEQLTLKGGKQQGATGGLRLFRSIVALCSLVVAGVGGAEGSAHSWGEDEPFIDSKGAAWGTAAAGVVGALGMGIWEAVDYCNREESVYTATLDLDTKGANLQVSSPQGSDAQCTISVAGEEEAKSTITIGSQAHSISLTNLDSAQFALWDGKHIMLDVQDPDGSENSSNLDMDTGSISLTSGSIELKRENGGRVLLDNTGLDLKADGNNYIKMASNGITMKFTQPTDLTAVGTLKLNSQSMVMIG